MEVGKKGEDGDERRGGGRGWDRRKRRGKMRE